MEKEIRLTCNLWIEKVKENMQSASPAHTAKIFKLWTRRRQLKQQKKIERFETILVEGLTARITETFWDEQEPKKGCALRQLYCDYRPEELLEKAALQCGISTDIIPKHAYTETNPGFIKYKFQEDETEKVLSVSVG